MIPEAYWRFLGRWWWLVGLFAIAGFGLGYLWLSTTPKRFASVAILEINYVRTVEGKVKLDESARSKEAKRIALELSSGVEIYKLHEFAIEQGFPGSVGQLGALDAPASIDIDTPPASRKSTPPYLIVEVLATTGDEAEWLAELGARYLARRVQDRYDDALERQLRYRKEQVDEKAGELERILEDKRDALAGESALGVAMTQQLLDDHSRLLSELLVVLGALREEANVASLDFGVNVQSFDLAVSELADRVTTARRAWEDSLETPLAVIGGIQAQPEYQLAVVRERVLQTQYRDNIEQAENLVNGVGGSEVVTIVNAASIPEQVLQLGIRKRYVVIFATGLGGAIGWALASFGENALRNRARRRETMATEEQV